MGLTTVQRDCAACDKVFDSLALPIHLLDFGYAALFRDQST